jgi:O-antigen/teichoic acid export membrane protein
VIVSNDSDSSVVRFKPLRPASRKRLLLGLVLGPLLWIVALIVVAAVLHYSSAIELGLLAALISAVASTIVLLILRHGRIRQEKRYAARG